MSWRKPRQLGLASAIWRFVEERRGEPFTASDVAKALPQLTRSGIRSYLYTLAVTERITATPSHKGSIYRQRLGNEPDPFLIVLERWARDRGKAPSPEGEPELTPCS